MNGGRIILADEPTGALDSQSGEDVMELLRSMHQQGHTIIVITHAREVAERADRLIEIKDGEILSDTTKRDIPDRQAPQRLQQASDGHAARIADISEAVKMAMRALRANIFRTVLTLLGIIIGVSSVVTMLAIGTGAQNSILDRINAMGTDLVLVRPSMPGFRGGSIATLVPADADAILELPNIKSAVPEVTGTVTLRRGNVDYQSQANGTVSAFSEAKSWKLATGDFITQNDMTSYAPVAVLGTTVVKTLFPDGSNPIGQHILIQKIPFQVIGTLEPKGAGFGGTDQDDVVVVPLSTGNLRLFGQKYVRTITVQVKDSDLINTTQEQIQELLDQRHKQRDTMITNMSSVRDDAAAMGSTMTLFLGSVAAISLLVGGIGVMNIMLVSVTERTREIGVRMATGARRRDILLQFITEALTVSAIGGAFGVVIGLGAAAIAGWAGLSVGYSIGPVLLAFACAFATGLIFGFLPARKASRLLPAVALSSE
jgi:macrolide transport system ATP-binding/permease protein